MDDDVRLFGDTLGRAALARDWPGVHALLAPWLQRSMSTLDVQAFFEAEYRRTLEANGVEEMAYPEHPDPELDGNAFMNATELRKPISWEGNKVRVVAPDVTDDNVRYWMSLKLACSDAQMERLGFDHFAESWMSIVSTEGGLRVGYWSQSAY